MSSSKKQAILDAQPSPAQWKELQRKYELQDQDLAHKKNQLLRLTKAFKTTEVGITITDNSGRIVYSNPADAKMHGYTVEELIGKPSNIFAPKITHSRKKTRIHFDEYANWKREGINVSKDGIVFPVNLISNVIKDSQGQNIGMVVVCEDITEQKKAETALKESEQQLRRLNTTKDKFFSIIGHDLKNPLTALMGYSELIIDRYDTLSPEMIKDMILEINSSAEQLHKLTENLLNWSRVQTGQIGFNPKQVNLYSVVRDSVNLLEPLLKAKGVAVDLSVPENIGAFVDPNMLNAVLQNLLTNGIKFSKPDNYIFIKARTLNTLVEVTIADTGVGVPAALLPTLFKIDVSHSTRGTANESGTGLGLILCKEFIELHHCTISADSEEGKGATFRFTLPTSESAYGALQRE